MTSPTRGSVVLLDGPAAGRYSVRRAPYFLRAVIARDGRLDLLDQLHDEPRPVERVHVYEAAGPLWSAEAERRAGTIICPPPGASGEYRHRPDVDGEQLRETEAWREWCRSQPGAEDLYEPTEAAR